MDDIRITLDILFHHQDPEVILKKIYDTKPKSYKDDIVSKIDDKIFAAIFSHLNPNYYSKDEIENVIDIVEEEWMRESDNGFNDGRDKKEANIFNIIRMFTKDTIKSVNQEPNIQYKKLLKWSDISKKLGEDLFTCAYYADFDLTQPKNRNYLAWRPIISTDNNKLRELLSKGIAENHMHLKGSAPHFQLSWISLMNNTVGREDEFKKLNGGSSLSGDISAIVDPSNKNIFLLVKKASAIRLELFKHLVHELEITKSKLHDDESRDRLDYLLRSTDDLEFKMFINELQNDINVMKNDFGYKFDNEYVDYCIMKNISPMNYCEKGSLNSNLLLSGERWFLYNIFKLIYSNKNKDLWCLFYVYLIIKNKMRSELIQINERVGFANFSDYQNRKGFFIKKRSIFERAIVNMAVASSKKDQNILKFEARIGPENSSVEYISNLKKLDDFISNDIDRKTRDVKLMKAPSKKVESYGEENDDCFYVVHLIKTQDTSKSISKEKDILLQLRPRNFNVRFDIKTQSLALAKLRESASVYKHRIKGLDAANFEIGCRPETFSQSYRYLKKYKTKNEYDFLCVKPVDDLGFTYHVGEDYLDIIDGLRSIDEAVKFLELSDGDRLGHAIALGLDVDDYYKCKRKRTTLPRQDILDNCVWLYFKMNEYNINNLKVLKDLENYFHKYFNIVYYNFTKGEKFESNQYFDMKTYYDAYKLRADNPEIYYSDEYKEKKPAITFWQSLNKSRYDGNLPNIRLNEKATTLYRAYHYDSFVKKEGAKASQFEASKELISVVKQVQKHLQSEVLEKNIYIETNPSSNYLISSFKRFSKHPLTSFYNFGLVNNVDDIENCNQLHVSINTDDQGVFATYLENEYALMALALEKECDEDGNKRYKPEMIYNWLDNIRVKGLEQSFVKTKYRQT